MSDSKNADSSEIREAVGVFVNTEVIKEAIDELLENGFHKEELGLLASEDTVRQSLGDLYAQTNQDSDSKEAPNIAFVGKESLSNTTRAGLGGLFFVGTTTAAGGVVASAAVLGGSLLAAISGAAAVGAVGAVLSLFIHENAAQELEKQVDQGHLLLFVRLVDDLSEERAKAVLQKHTPIDVLVVNAPGRSD